MKNRNFTVLNFNEKEINISLDFLQNAVKGVEFAVIIYKPISELKQKFFDQYQLIEAAGGVVLNEKEEVLIIYRRGKWDLPKGKKDEGEKFRAAALREVREETGLENLKITSPIRIKGKQKFTYHLYLLNKIPVIKATRWYLMKTTDSLLTPQAEEDITEARWVSKNDLKNYANETFQLIRQVLKDGLE